MSKTGKTAGIVAVVVLIILGIVIAQYNGLASSYEAVQEKQSAVDVAMQRRVDLIPNLLSLIHI